VNVNNVGRNKAEIMRDFINHIDLGVSTVAMDALIDLSPDAIDALSACDVVFGCTDDDLGRQALNAAVSYYGLVYIDLGLGGQIAEGADGLPRMTYQEGRISTLLPEFGECLFCQRVTSEKDAKRQQAVREKPDVTESELKERYLNGGHEPSPGIGPFTSAIADFGVATLFDLITPYRNLPGELRRDLILIDFVRMNIRSVSRKKDGGCPYCGTRQHKLRITSHRLNRPILGRNSLDV
jgi:molybdopterin-synthase adenylyltransferase